MQVGDWLYHEQEFWCYPQIGAFDKQMFGNEKSWSRISNLIQQKKKHNIYVHVYILHSCLKSKNDVTSGALMTHIIL